MKRKLNPRICRTCGKVFRPKTALQRYGNDQCRVVGAKLSPGQRYQSMAIPGAVVYHP